jgi:hypothetical protein
MQVEIDTHERGGERLPQIAQSAPLYATDVFGSLDTQADDRVRAIIAANEPRAASAARGAAPASGVAADRGAGKAPLRQAQSARGKLM